MSLDLIHLTILTVPDAVVALSPDGKITFVSVQLLRILQHESNKLIGMSIEDILSEDSKGPMRRLLKDLMAAEHAVTVGGKDSSSSSEDNSSNVYSGSSSNENKAVKSSEQTFPLLEVNCDDEVGQAKEVTCSKHPERKADGSPDKGNLYSKTSLKHKPSSLSFEDNAEGASSPREYIDSNENIGMNVDNVMGAPVTKNNATAKLSSLMHYPKETPNERDEDRKPAAKRAKQQDVEEGPRIHRKFMLAPPTSQRLCSQFSSTDSDQRAGINSSEESRIRDSNESSSDGYVEDQDSSSMSGSTSLKKG